LLASGPGPLVPGQARSTSEENRMNNDQKKKKLRLHKDTIRALSDTELKQVDGGIIPIIISYFKCSDWGICPFGEW
jgi:hypothetical protein